MVIYEQTWELDLVGGYRRGDSRNYSLIQPIPLNGYRYRGGIYRRLYF